MVWCADCGPASLQCFAGVDARHVSLLGRLIVKIGAQVGTVIATVAGGPPCTTSGRDSTNVVDFEPRYLLTSIVSLWSTRRRSLWCLTSGLLGLSTDRRMVGGPKFALKNLSWSAVGFPRRTVTAVIFPRLLTTYGFRWEPNRVWYPVRRATALQVA